jgi:hypothetical protein
MLKMIFVRMERTPPTGNNRKPVDGIPKGDIRYTQATADITLHRF